MWRCKFCGKEFDTLTPSGKANHSRWCEKNPKKMSYLKGLETMRNNLTPEQRNKAKETLKAGYKSGRISPNLFPSHKGTILSQEHKDKVSRALTISHENGHPGWTHINADINRRSYPEKWFIENVLKRYDLFSIYTIQEKLPFGKYFLDFAFLELKLDVEIDGQQHTRSKEAITHDLLRDNFLNEKGWRTYRIIWKGLQQNIDDEIPKFLKYLNNIS